jgi:hypothetical protein
MDTVEVRKWALAQWDNLKMCQFENDANT